MRQDRRGFTLIELLTVVAIISILAAILFPVFARARERARTVNCATNLHQIALAMHLYAQDYGGRFPPPSEQFALPIMDYVKNWQIFSCPSSPNPFTSPEQQTVYAYLYEGGHCTDDPPQTRLVYDSELRHIGGGNVAFLSGKIKLISQAEWSARGWTLPHPPACSKEQPPLGMGAPMGMAPTP
ncbi:MAG TPA: type II secretion system protein [Armatimonadetes bacterium]|nr:type II secretion system protein [Armatimonadota bacterium]